MSVFGDKAASSVRKGEGSLRQDVISVAQACEFLGVHRNTLYKHIRTGEVPAFKLMPGGRWRLRKSALEEWLEDRQGRGVR